MNEVQLAIARLLNYCEDIDSKEMYESIQIIAKHIDTLEEEMKGEKYMGVVTDGRFEIIDRAKKHILEATNIETSPKEMEVLDDFLFRCWQMGWLKKYEMERK